MARRSQVQISTSWSRRIDIAAWERSIHEAVTASVNLRYRAALEHAA